LVPVKNLLLKSKLVTARKSAGEKQAGKKYENLIKRVMRENLESKEKQED